MVKMTRRFELDGVRVDIEEIFGERISGETKYHGTHLWPGYFLQILYYPLPRQNDSDKISQESQVLLFCLHFLSKVKYARGKMFLSSGAAADYRELSLRGVVRDRFV